SAPSRILPKYLRSDMGGLGCAGFFSTPDAATSRRVRGEKRRLFRLRRRPQIRRRGTATQRTRGILCVVVSQWQILGSAGGGRFAQRRKRQALNPPNEMDEETAT